MKNAQKNVKCSEPCIEVLSCVSHCVKVNTTLILRLYCRSDSQAGYYNPHCLFYGTVCQNPFQLIKPSTQPVRQAIPKAVGKVSVTHL